MKQPVRPITKIQRYALNEISQGRRPKVPSKTKTSLLKAGYLMPRFEFGVKIPLVDGQGLLVADLTDKGHARLAVKPGRPPKHPQAAAEAVKHQMGFDFSTIQPPEAE